MEVNYAQFLERKKFRAEDAGIEDHSPVNALLFPFQRDITEWALRKGRAAIWADCGLGKTWMSAEWARIVCEHTARPSLILTPLAVAEQFVTEGAKLGIEVRHAKSQSDINPRGISVANYERLHLFEPSLFAGVVLDESSILKDYSSATRNALIEAFGNTPYRLACSATPAPNDHIELGNHAEFLGAMTRTEMLSMFFVHDGGETQKWRLKGHAKEDFWSWVCSWACSLRYPSDLGYSDDGYQLPPLNIEEHVIRASEESVAGMGMLFAAEARTIHDQRSARRATMTDRVRHARALIESEPGEQWLVWCDLNAESEGMASAIVGAKEVIGSQSLEVKERILGEFSRGELRCLVTKPSIAGHGMNWQQCARVIFLGVSHSFEAWYQAIRRTYRFGQLRPVVCHIVTSEAEGAVVANLKRKQADAERMASAMVAETREQMRKEFHHTTRAQTRYNASLPMEIPSWLRTQAQ
jgi:hypothetical protein